jgi:hypothetical protein
LGGLRRSHGQRRAAATLTLTLPPAPTPTLTPTLTLTLTLALTTGKGEPPQAALLELAAVLGRAGYHTPGAVPSALRARALDALCELSLLSAALPGGPKVSATDPNLTLTLTLALTLTLTVTLTLTLTLNPNPNANPNQGQRHGAPK